MQHESQDGVSHDGGFSGLDDDNGQSALLELTKQVGRRWEDRLRINSLEPHGSGMHFNFM